MNLIISHFLSVTYWISQEVNCCFINIIIRWHIWSIVCLICNLFIFKICFIKCCRGFCPVSLLLLFCTSFLFWDSEKTVHVVQSSWSEQRIRLSYYRKFPKYSDTHKLCCNHSKMWTMWLYHREMSPNETDGMANIVDPDQTAPLGAVWSGSTLFSQAYLSENFGSLWYMYWADNIVLQISWSLTKK